FYLRQFRRVGWRTLILAEEFISFLISNCGGNSLRDDVRHSANQVRNKRATNRSHMFVNTAVIKRVDVRQTPLLFDLLSDFPNPNQMYAVQWKLSKRSRP